MVRFIHTADNHLGSPFKGLGERDAQVAAIARQASYTAFERVIDRALEEQVDFLIVAGDLYDSAVQHIKELVFVQRQFERLAAADIAVFLIRGNHDFEANSQMSLTFPENVHVFSSTIETIWFQTKRGEQVALTGFSYSSRNVSERMAQQFPLRDPKADVQIGMYHGFYESSLANEGKYAPFSLGELQAKQYDYWALGHIHKRHVLHEQPYIVYPGNTQGFRRLETGAKGAYLVEINEQRQAQLEFFATHEVEWAEVTLNLTGATRLQDVWDTLNKTIASLEPLSERVRKRLISLRITNYYTLAEDVLVMLRGHDAMETINKDEQYNYIYKIDVVPLEKKRYWPTQDALEESFQLQVQQIHDPVQFKLALTDLLDNGHVQQLFPHLREDESFQQEVIEQMESLIQQQFQKRSATDED